MLWVYRNSYTWCDCYRIFSVCVVFHKDFTHGICFLFNNIKSIFNCVFKAKKYTKFVSTNSTNKILFRENQGNFICCIADCLVSKSMSKFIIYLLKIVQVDYKHGTNRRAAFLIDKVGNIFFEADFIQKSRKKVSHGHLLEFLLMNNLSIYVYKVSNQFYRLVSIFIISD